MEIVLGILAALAAIVLVILLLDCNSNRKIKRKIRWEWGAPDPNRRLDIIDNISSYWDDMLKFSPPACFIDTTTWYDLNMDDVFERLDYTKSSVGEEYLYARMHTLSFDEEDDRVFASLCQGAKQNPAAREKVQFWLAKLGRKPHNGVSMFLFHPGDYTLERPYLFPILTVLLCAMVVLTIIRPLTGLPLLIISVIVNMVVYYRNKTELEQKLSAVQYISAMVNCCKKIVQVPFPQIQPELDRLKELTKPFLKLKAARGPAGFTGNANEMNILTEYVKIIFMYDFLNYNKIVKTIRDNREEFARLFAQLGKIDAAFSTASWQESLDEWCTPVFCEESCVKAQDLYHPLIHKPVKNPVNLTRSAIITGSNASGKSTYVKAVAINAILAQTLQTALASSFTMRRAQVYSSMAVQDSIVGGESYFIAEINSLQRILKAMENGRFTLAFVDEILRGTNTIERIAASSAILKWFSQKDCICLVASHDIELTEILKHYYDNLSFKESFDDDGIYFDYKLQQGFATTKNAIKLLEYKNYPSQVVHAAQQRAQKFEQTRAWDVEP